MQKAGMIKLAVVGRSEEEKSGVAEDGGMVARERRTVNAEAGNGKGCAPSTQATEDREESEREGPVRRGGATSQGRVQRAVTWVLPPHLPQPA